MTDMTRTAAPRITLASLWSDVKLAARGSRHDYTQGAIGRAIFLLAVPMVLEMVMESLFAVADVFWVGHLGADAVATVGLTETMMIIIYTLAMGLAISMSAIIARRIGEKDPDQAARTAVQGLTLGLLVSGVLAGIGALFAPQLLALMGAAPTVIASGSTFARVMLGGSSTAFLLFNVNAAFRGAGDAAISMRVLWLSNALNIVLGPLFIFGVGPFPHLGVTGAAVATTIGRGTGLLFALYRLSRGSGHIALRRTHLVLDPALMWRIVRMSGNATFQVLVGSMSWVWLVRIMASFGSVAMAGYTISVRMLMFALLPAWGLSNAAATMVGQSLGAGNPDRAEKAVWTAAKINVVFLGLTGLLFVMGAPWIVAQFTNDAAVLAAGTTGLRIMSSGFPMYALGMVLTQSFNGAGDTATPTAINLLAFWAFEIPFAWALSRYTTLGQNGVFVAVLLAYTVLAGVSWVMFKRGRWRRMKA